MKKNNLVLITMILLFGILFINIISAEEALKCCERLKDNGPWCQSAPASECATGTNLLTNQPYKSASTSCLTASFCKMGTCINPIQGTCLPNTPQSVCDLEGGVWKSSKMEDLGECQLACCLLGNQAVFTTLTECKKLSSEAGLTTNYRKDITDEIECIASIDSGEMGACVFEKEYQNTCLVTTQTECNEIKKATYSGEGDVEGVNRESVEFHKDYLCSAPQLGTSCGKTKTTKCVDEKVYFLDTCGNLANIYDASKVDDSNYWTFIQESSCDDGKGNKNSAGCGECDYFSGSICKDYQKGKTVKPTYGNSFCSSLDCKYDVNGDGDSTDSGDIKFHGESWCVENSKKVSKTDLTGLNLPGSRDFRLMCYNGEVITEPCAEFRNEICIEDEVNDYSFAKCLINRWQDCINQTNPEDCDDKYARDCKWIKGYSILKNGDGADLGKDDKDVAGSCLPKYTPGFEFWSGEGVGPETCALATSTCVVQYELDVFVKREDFGKWSWATKANKCVKNCYCIPGYDGVKIKTTKENKYEKTNPAFRTNKEWIDSMNNICTSLGDCGNKLDYLGYSGDVKKNITNEFIAKP